jgi:hypothetical protein
VAETTHRAELVTRARGRGLRRRGRHPAHGCAGFRPAGRRWDLSARERSRHFWIPEGFAHGFVTLSERAIFTYLCTAPYDAASDGGIRWNDAQIGIDWPVSAPSLSGKDGVAPFLKDIPADRLPVYSK